MKPSSKTSLLGYLLMGLIRQQPQSGYDLRKLFATTPLMSFSDSPGAIYPALKKLEDQEMIRSEVKEGSGLRLRRVFRITPAGLSQLRHWLSQPVTRHDVIRNMDQMMVRFSFMDGAVGTHGAVRLLHDLERELAGYVPELRGYLKKHGPAMPLSSRLALDSGVRSYESLLHWARAALAAYEQAEKES